jgi:uncharacterized membrane protein
MMRNLVEFASAISLGALLGSVMVRVGPGLPISVAISFALILVLFHVCQGIEGEAQLVAKIFLVSAVGRVLLAIFLHNVIRDPATLAGDDSGYEVFGKTLAQAWSEDNDILKAQLGRYLGGRELQNAYVYWNALLFYVFGAEVALLPKCINAVIGSLTPIFFYRIAWRVSNPIAARYVLYISVIAPSMILWSVLNLRDSFAILAITTSIYYTISLKENFQLSDMFKLGVSMIAVTALRTYMFVILGLALALSFIGFRKGRELRDLWVGFLVAVVLLYLFRGLGVGENEALKNASFEQLHQMRTGLASGSSAYAVGADVSSPLKALIFLPVGVIFFLFTPFPWEISGFRQLLAFPEVLLFYWLFPSMVRGLRRALKENFVLWLPVLLPAFLVTVTYSLVEGNVGTAFRHKAQVLGLYFILAAYDIAARQREREAP